LLLAVLSAVGAEALWVRSPDARRGAIAVFVSVVLLQVVSVHLRTLADGNQWQSVEELATAEFLEDAPSGVVVELPYDLRDQFLSVLQAPGHQRVNPLRPKGQRFQRATYRQGENEAIWAWLDQLGRGQQVTSAPTRAGIAGAGVRWIFYDPQRCEGDAALVRAAQCNATIPTQLKAVLGRGRRLGDGVMLWELAGSF
jgi:hypothetical protein